jgi:hypothetical protein
MPSDIRIYLEGGGTSLQKSMLKRGFREFLRELDEMALDRNIVIRPIPCGDREKTFKNFRRALKSDPDAFNILLVDAEGPVKSSSCKQHLRNRDGWEMPGINEDQCHLMVQMFEAWLIADPEALKSYYGKGFNEKSILGNPNVEEIGKSEIEKCLKQATSKTKKGKYHKINHAAQLLGLLDPSKVRAAAPHCRRLFETLEDKVAD